MPDEIISPQPLYLFLPNVYPLDQYWELLMQAPTEEHPLIKQHFFSLVKVPPL